MPNLLPNNLYNQYTERLNTTPFVQFNLQQKARKEAREEATRQYFTKLAGSINTAGIAQKHLQGEHGGLLEDIDTWRRNMMMNRGAIAKGGWAQQQAMQEYQQLLQKVDQAKTRTKNELELGKMVLEGKYNPDEEDLKTIDKIGGSIYDPSTYKEDGVSEYNYNDLSPNVPPFDADKQAKFFAATTKGVQAGKVYDYSKSYKNPTTGQVIVPFKEMFSTDQIKRSADEAARLVNDDKSAKRYYNKVLDNPESDDWQKLNNAYQSVYGKDKLVSTPQQAAAADAIMRFSAPQKEGEEQELNYAQRQADKRMNIYLNMGKNSGSELDINDIYRGIKNKVSGNINRGFEATRFSSLAENEQEAVKKAVENTGIKIDERGGNIYIAEDNGEVKVYKAEDGKPLPKIKENEITTLSFVGTNLPKQADVKAKRAVVERGGENKPTKQKTYKGLDKNGNPIFE